MNYRICLNTTEPYQRDLLAFMVAHGVQREKVGETATAGDEYQYRANTLAILELLIVEFWGDSDQCEYIERYGTNGWYRVQS